MNHLEIEYKTLLTKEEFNRIKEQMPHIEAVTQTNYYFDTDNFDLKASKMSLRIRTFTDKAELTLKVPQKIGNLEYNHDLLLSEAETIIHTLQLPDIEIKHIIAQTGISLKELKVLGSLTTVRREIATKIGLMALDYNRYAGIKDYELELEVSYAEKGKADFEAFLKANHIQFKYAKSKVARFSQTLFKQKK
ncbi:CYTH domain-containing protein [Streptococcus orisasini]|uniref:CYTH domain-containing protein n=1 Tax=Streptococcus orisasini TaxID=1080071 RepID=UPI00070DF007|nr:CYTH domain-containing protein [Streptococcus orisasini]